VRSRHRAAAVLLAVAVLLAGVLALAGAATDPTSAPGTAPARKEGR